MSQNKHDANTGCMDNLQTEPQNIYSYPPVLWELIAAELNDNDIRSGLMLACKYLNETIHKSDLFKRPKWYGVNYNEIASSQKLRLQDSVDAHRTSCEAYPLRNGDMAFALTGFYDERNPSYSFSGSPSRLCKDWQDNYQAILVFSSGMEKPIQLIGHQYGVKHVIQHNANTLASIGRDNTLRIWDKLTGIPKRVIQNFSERSEWFDFLNLLNKVLRSSFGYIDNPLHLQSLNNDELACFNANGTAHVWNVTTGECVREFLNLSSQRVEGFVQKNGHLIIRHENKENDHYSSWLLKKHSILDIKKETLIKTLVTAELKPRLLKHLDTIYKNHPYLSQNHYKESFGSDNDFEDMECIDYDHGIAVLLRHRTIYFYDINNENIIFGFPGQNVQYKFLAKGTLVILYHTAEGWHVMADYCQETKDFKVKYSQSEEDRNQQYEYFEDRSWLILHNGNILTYHLNTGFSSQWCLSTQCYLSEFELEIPPIPLNMKVNCIHNNALKCLPDGNILGCSDDGVFAIWDGKQGKLLQHKKLTKSESNDLFDCFNISSQGDLYFTWRVDPPSNMESMFPDAYESELLRFNFFQNPAIKNRESTTNDNAILSSASEDDKQLAY